MKILEKTLSYLFFIGIIVYFGVKLYFNASQLDHGDIASNFKTNLIDGSSFELNELRGNWILLYFWGSWCGPCIKELPDLLDLRKQYKDKLTFVTIGLEKNKTNGLRTSKQFGFDWKHQIIEVNKFVILSSIAQKYRVTNIPAKFLIRPNGKIIKLVSSKDIRAYLK